MIEDLHPEIFGVQEAYSYQVEYLTSHLKDYKSIGVGREDGKSEGEHMSIFYDTTRIKLLKWGTFWLSETPDSPSLGWDAACRRTATWAFMEDTRAGKKFFYVNTHLDHVGVNARINGLNLIVDKIAQINPEGVPMILTGDFNVEPGDPSLEKLDKRMTSAREAAKSSDKGTTFNDWGDERSFATLDYVYYSGFKGASLFEVVRKPYAGHKYVSDHYPVRAVLEY